MSKLQYLLVLLMMHLPKVLANVRQVPSKIYSGFKATGVYKDNYSKDRLDCYQLCLSEASCKAFNYRKADRKCQFVNIAYPDLIADVTFTFTVAKVINVFTVYKITNQSHVVQLYSSKKITRN